MVHHALGFLPEPAMKQVLLQEISPLSDDSQEFSSEKAMHCLKVIKGELFLLCNIRLRSAFIEQNVSAFDDASCIEVPNSAQASIIEDRRAATMMQGAG
jgi:hypothetical protein